MDIKNMKLGLPVTFGGVVYTVHEVQADFSSAILVPLKRGHGISVDARTIERSVKVAP